ncbi:protein pygopus-like, partial [Engraulis encrasicolus]|uniref:protein pygopus-like n=1 Tax=Engraulis encrasicolus TaxID=184585 RepID=UPI002FD06DEE
MANVSPMSSGPLSHQVFFPPGPGGGPSPGGGGPSPPGSVIMQHHGGGGSSIGGIGGTPPISTSASAPNMAALLGTGVGGTGTHMGGFPHPHHPHHPHPPPLRMGMT